MLNDALPVTLQYQLKDAILKKIKDGEWASGFQVPSEREFCDAYGVSRTTVREVLKDLVQDGYMIRKQGKGTFIASPTFEQTMTSYYSLSEDIAGKGLTSVFTTVSFGACLPTEKVAGKLGIAPTDPVYEVIRLRLIDTGVFAWERALVPCELMEGADAADIERDGLYITIMKRSGWAPDEAEESFEAVNCPEDIAALLKIEPGTAVLRLLRWTKAKGRYVEYCESLIQGEKFKYKHVLKKKGI